MRGSSYAAETLPRAEDPAFLLGACRILRRRVQARRLGLVLGLFVQLPYRRFRRR